MDPEATLTECKVLLSERFENPFALADAAEHLLNYAEWRAKGGFEPNAGDIRAHRMLSEFTGAFTAMIGRIRKKG